jgi:hypothetical protein
VNFTVNYTRNNFVTSFTGGGTVTAVWTGYINNPSGGGGGDTPLIGTFLELTPQDTDPVGVANGWLWLTSHAHANPDEAYVYLNGVQRRVVVSGGAALLGTDTIFPVSTATTLGLGRLAATGTGISTSVASGVWTINNTGALLTANVFTGLQDFGGATVEIPNSANAIPTALGNVAFDTVRQLFSLGDGTNNYRLLPLQTTYRWASWVSSTDSATSLTSAMGEASLNVLGTPTDGTHAGVAPDANNGSLDKISAKTNSGSYESLNGSKLWWWGATRNIYFAWLGYADTVANVRNWVGFSDQTGTTMAGSDGANTYKIAAFRQSSSASDTNWMCVTENATGSGSPTVTDSGVAPNTTTPQLMEIIESGSNALFYIGGTLVCTNASRVPTAAALRPWWSVTTLETAATVHSISWGRAFVGALK